MGPQKAELKKLYDRYVRDPVFEHLRKDDINFVGGSGPLTPKIMLIGEAPGRIENAKQIPFVGPAGQELTSILQDVHINPVKDVFFTNVVKYWPRTILRETRAPSEKEIRESREYILQEISIVDPLFVGLCGRISIRTIFPNVESVRSQNGKLLIGKFVLQDGTELQSNFIPLYHPAVVLYKREKRNEVVMGYRVLRSLLDAKEATKE